MVLKSLLLDVRLIQVSSLMEWAARESVCLVPFGGGTSVTRALELPSIHVEPRPVVSVDMRKVIITPYWSR